MDQDVRKADAPTRVAIIGGGIAGLTAAWHLKQRGFKVAVFEDRVHLGGKLGADPGRYPLKGNRALAGHVRRKKDGSHENGLWEREELRKRSTLSEAEVGRITKLFEFLSQPPDKRTKSLDPADGVADDLLTVLERILKGRVVSVLEGARRWDDVEAACKDLDSSASRCATIERSLDTVEASPIGDPSKRGEHSSLMEAEMAWRVSCATKSSRQPRVTFCVALHRRMDGQFVLDINDGVRHEHCYHMYLNWYRNFWALMKAIGLEKTTHFVPRDGYVHVFPGDGPLEERSRFVNQMGSIEHWTDNLLSGIGSVSDVFLGSYSVLDLISQPLDPERYLDRQSVHGFLSARGYATEGALRLHEYLLLRAFAVPTYYTSAYAYQKYLSFTLASPSPTLWIYRSNADEMFRVFRERLETGPNHVDFYMGHRVSQLALDDSSGKVRHIVFRPSDMRWPRGADDGERQSVLSGPEQETTFDPDYVIVAVPPKALADLVSEFRERVPGLSRVRKLQSGVTAVLDLYLNRHLGGIPEDHLILRGSKYGLTVFDNAQLWAASDRVMPEVERVGADPHSPPKTCLSVAVADFYKIDGMEKPDAVREIVDDLRRFLAFDDADIDYSRTYLQLNANEPLFVNEVGSEPWRPETRTEIDNLFLAGDFVANDIEMVCVEGAVVTGIQAARAVQAQLRADRPEILAKDARLGKIDLLMPDELAPAKAEALKGLLASRVPLAFARSRSEELRAHPERWLAARDARAAVDSAFDLPASMASDASAFPGSVARWLTDLPLRRP